MEKIGVAAVVEGLSGFMGDMGKMDDAIRGLISPTNILGSVFGGLGRIFENVGSFVVNTLAHALGELLADAVQWVTSQIKELISSTIEAAGEFQKLELRLNTLNFNDLTDSGMEFNAAQKEAVRLTKEQLSWLQKLAAQTPYDNTDISNVYTLARGYSFNDEEARKLTETIIDFTSGMGLGNTEIVRIIKNFGQMRQLGKLTQRDLNDLATGAFVPVNKILAQMRVETGLSGKAFDDFRVSGEGVDLFLATFTKMVESDFGGAAQKMARTFGAATDNVKDFIKSVVGLNIVKPILDVLGGRVAGFMDELTSEDRWNSIVGLATRIGTSLSSIVTDILDLAPDAKGMADAIVDAFGNIADWIDQHHDDIVNFARDSAAWIETTLIPAVERVWDFLFGSDMQPGAIQKFGAWLKDEFLPFIQTQVIPGVADLFDAITGKKQEAPTTMSGDKQGGAGEDTTALQNVVAGVASLATALPSVLELLGAIGDAILVSFGGDETQTFSEFVTGTLIPAIQDLTQWIRDNQETVGLFVKTLLLLEGLAIVVGIVFSLVAAFASLAIGGSVLAAIVTSVNNVISVVERLKLSFAVAVGAILGGVLSMYLKFLEFKANVARTFTEMMDAIKNKDWTGVGRALVDGIKRGLQNAWTGFMSTVRTLAQNALNAFNAIFNIHSPSKEMFNIGQNIVKGLAKGVADSTGIAVKAMAGTANSMLAAATPQMSYTNATTAPSQNTYSNTNNFNATFSSNTQKEPLLQDFSMLASLVGS